MPTGIVGPIPKNTVGLLLGRSSLTSKGVIVHTGIIDPDFKGEIQIVMSSSVPWSAKRGEKVAHLLLIPYIPPNLRGTQKRTGGFGSTGLSGTFLAEKISSIRPLCHISLQDRKFLGLMDTGADVSIICSQDWPANWPTQQANINVVGVGEISKLLQSTHILPCLGPEGQKGFLQPYIADIPISLWGRDLLSQWRAEIVIPPGQYSHQSQQMMKQMGYLPGQGLGKFNQGITQPLQPVLQVGRKGVGFHSQNQQPFC